MPNEVRGLIGGSLLMAAIGGAVYVTFLHLLGRL